MLGSCPQCCPQCGFPTSSVIQICDKSNLNQHEKQGRLRFKLHRLVSNIHAIANGLLAVNWFSDELIEQVCDLLISLSQVKALHGNRLGMLGDRFYLIGMVNTVVDHIC